MSMNELDNHIESALKKEIDFKLSDSFSDRIIEMVMTRAKRERKWELIGIITTGVLFLAALIVTFVLTEFSFSLGVLTFLSDHLGLIGFAIVFIVLLNILDKKIVRKQQPT